ncbi:hypothetical protein ABEF95_005923 [Exophiala dermatitidis]
MDLSQIEQDIARDLARHIKQKRKREAGNNVQVESNPEDRAEHAIRMIREQQRRERHPFLQQPPPAFNGGQPQLAGSHAQDAGMRRSQGLTVRAPNFPRWDPYMRVRRSQETQSRRLRSPGPLNVAPTPASVLSGQFRPAEFSEPDDNPNMYHRPATSTRQIADGHYRHDPSVQQPPFADSFPGSFQGANTNSERLVSVPENKRQRMNPTKEQAFMPDLNWGPHYIYRADGTFNVHPPHGDTSYPQIIGMVAPPGQLVTAHTEVARGADGQKDADTGGRSQGHPEEEGTGPNIIPIQDDPEFDDVDWDMWMDFSESE